MKFAAIIRYAIQVDKLNSLHPDHQIYLRGILSSGQFFAAGAINDDAGALWIVKADSLEKADEVVKDDLWNAAGFFTK